SGLGLAAQMDIGKRYCEFKKLDFQGFFADEAESSETPLEKRPGGQALSDRLERGDHVVFPKLDRGFRDTVDMLKTVEHWVDKGIVVHFCDLGIDTSSPAWLLLATVQSAFARAERDRIRERTSQALQALKRRGQRWGASAPSGFKWVPDLKGGKTKHGNPVMMLASNPEECVQMQ